MFIYSPGDVEYNVRNTGHSYNLMSLLNNKITETKNLLLSLKNLFISLRARVAPQTNRTSVRAT